MMASQKKEWLGLAVSIGLAVVLSVGAIATFGGAGNAERADGASGIEVQTPDQTGTIGTDKGVKKFQTTDAYSLAPEHRAE